MKNNIIVLVAVSGIMALTSCNKKVNETTTIKDSIEVTTTEAVKTETPAVEIKTVEGIVKSTNHGKDGFTAELETEDGVYFVTISHSNLTDHAQYREVKEGDKLKVTGDSWMMDDKNQITVRVID